MKKFIATLMATLMAVGMLIGGGATAFAAGSSTATDEYDLEVSYETTDGTQVGSYFVSSDYYLLYYLTEDLALEGMPDGYELISDFEYGVSWTYTAVGVTVYVQAVDTTEDTDSTTDTTTTETTTDTTTTETTTETTTTTDTTITAETTTKTTVEETVEVVEDSDYIEDLVARIHLASVDGTGVVETTN